MIQLIRRDSTIIELEATNIGFSIQRKVLVHTIPLLATRAALDLNIPEVSITIDGIITDDEEATGSAAAEMSLDLSLSFGNAGATWYASIGSAWAGVKTRWMGRQSNYKLKVRSMLT